MQLIKKILVFCIISGAFISCSDTSTNVVKPVEAKLYQVGECKSHSAPKISLTSNSTLKGLFSDTSFSYSFTDTLIVDFWALGNCASIPNRFYLSYNIISDTIFVVAIDTGGQYANCFCIYVIQTEFANLPLDHYVFYGIVPGNDMVLPDFPTPRYYIEDVYRSGFK